MHILHISQNDIFSIFYIFPIFCICISENKNPKTGLTAAVRPVLRWHIFEFFDIFGFLAYFFGVGVYSAYFLSYLSIFCIRKGGGSYGKGEVHTAKRVHIFCIFRILLHILHIHILHILHILHIYYRKYYSQTRGGYCGNPGFEMTYFWNFRFFFIFWHIFWG